ncbi:MAG TPA: hypothetical protein PLQ54_17875, partial [Armatimonadota bacterium]|nr:hypothetical protein [Armatimonadota bacterium]
MSFTPAYLEIDATYLVPSASPLRTADEVDREGVRVAAPARENFELFLSRTAQPTPYAHFILNPANVQWDAESAEGGPDRAGWNAEWQSGTRIGDTAWTAELVIPWTALGGKPEPGETRRANVCRARIPDRELSAWSTVVDGFVEPMCFGEWAF